MHTGRGIFQGVHVCSCTYTHIGLYYVENRLFRGDSISRNFHRCLCSSISWDFPGIFFQSFTVDT